MDDYRCELGIASACLDLFLNCRRLAIGKSEKLVRGQSHACPMGLARFYMLGILGEGSDMHCHDKAPIP